MTFIKNYYLVLALTIFCFGGYAKANDLKAIEGIWTIDYDAMKKGDPEMTDEEYKEFLNGANRQLFEIKDGAMMFHSLKSSQKFDLKFISGDSKTIQAEISGISRGKAFTKRYTFGLVSKGKMTMTLEVGGEMVTEFLRSATAKDKAAFEANKKTAAKKK